MDETALALMARLDNVRDDVTDLRFEVSKALDAHEDHTERLKVLENLSEQVVDDIRVIKDGPLYSVDKFITKRVAQTTGGFGVLLYIAYTLI